MINRKLGLKVKVKHLAEESRIIRNEERKNYGDTREWLYLHRIGIVRPAARATHIAYAFAKGVPLNRVERYPDRIPTEIWKMVAAMVKKYSGKTEKEYLDWLGSSLAE